MIKKIMLLAVCVVLFVGTFTNSVSAIDISAEYACVIDLVTGRIIYEKNAYAQHSMASTTKIMTALLAIESGKLNDMLTIGENPPRQEGTSLYLKKGDKILMKDLLYGVMLQSGNDAAVAVAEHISGTSEKFAQLMTKRAKELGAKSTSFKNPNGLDADGHYTTAYDLAIITAYAMKNPIFSEIVSTKTKTIKFSDGNETRYLSNHNKMLSMYEGCNGVKTGYTKKTGRCLVSSANRNGASVIVVTLNAPSDWSDHKNLFDYAFNQYTKKDIVNSGQIIKSLNVEDSNLDVLTKEGYSLSALPADINEFKIDTQLNHKIVAPINKDEKLGELEVLYKNKVIKRIDLVASNDIYKQKQDKKNYLKGILKNWLLIF